MAFMVPVVKKEWDIYGSSAKSRREHGPRSARSRTTSESSQAFSRGPSFGSRPPGSSLSCSPAVDGWPARYQSRSSSRGSNLSQTACSPPNRLVPPARRRSSQQAAAGSPSQSAPGSFSGFHHKVMDRMMRALHMGEREDSRKA
ncbi:uncharacterized protein LOC122369309 [Amphibalanus amphitrite]|uniref:uncharacterized protein LOC122369309 n=1 Tax=Amphibalanus amphitrite TaxID=1232801 RepID=UPI001C91BB31|nr:uncharacterized protein LOC122369309 [Amphibalanus amphitrite]